MRSGKWSCDTTKTLRFTFTLAIKNWPDFARGCPLCHTEAENVRLYVQRCVALESCRRKFFAVIASLLAKAGRPGLHVLKTLMLGGDDQLLLILGKRVCFPAALLVERHQCGLAEWVLDKCTKNFLLMLDRMRQSFLGHLRIIAGRLWVGPSKYSSTQLELRQTLPLRNDASKTAVTLPRALLNDWMPPSPNRMCWAKGVSSRPSPFYTVRRGRCIGVFHKWIDCKASVAGLNDAVFKGFTSLQDALYAFQYGWK